MLRCTSYVLAPNITSGAKSAGLTLNPKENYKIKRWHTSKKLKGSQIMSVYIFGHRLLWENKGLGSALCCEK